MRKYRYRHPTMTRDPRYIIRDYTEFVKRRLARGEAVTIHVFPDSPRACAKNEVNHGLDQAFVKEDVRFEVVDPGGWE